jgi:hypothetical protein
VISHIEKQKNAHPLKHAFPDSWSIRNEEPKRLAHDSRWLAGHWRGVHFLLDHSIALAADRVESLSIKNVDVPTRVLNEAGILESPSCNGYAFPAHSHHVCDVLLRHLDLVTVYSVIALE